jgi:hypothetical protein
MADGPAFDDNLDVLLDNANTGRPANKARRAEAKGLVDYWVGKATGSFWPTLDKAKVLAGLKARIDDPDKIYQASTSLCGVASFVRELAWDDPVQYGLLGALLYQGGWGNLGKGHRLTRIEPRVPTRQAAVPTRGDEVMDHADWLVLASVRDAFNTFAYVHDKLEGLRGMTVRAMPAYFKAAGYDELVYNFDAVNTQGVANMEAATRFFKMGYAVVLFVHSSVLDKSDRVLPTAQHWIALRSPIQINYAWNTGQAGVRIDRVWSWGKEQSIPKGTTPYMPLTEFMGCYYGYLAARSVV